MNLKESRLYKLIQVIPASYKFFEHEEEKLLRSVNSLRREINDLYEISKELQKGSASMYDFKAILEEIAMIEILPMDVMEDGESISDTQKTMIYSATANNCNDSELKQLACGLYSSLVSAEKIVSKMLKECGKDVEKANHPEMLDVFEEAYANEPAL